jgi:HEPN domain-containing protein
MEEGILKKNAKQFMKSAKLIYDTQDYTSATILYFKALFSILDFKIFEKTGKIPKDHNERFRFLQSSFTELYSILDKIYYIYRNAYSLIISEEDCKLVKNNVERIAKEQGIE